MTAEKKSPSVDNRRSSRRNEDIDSPKKHNFKNSPQSKSPGRAHRRSTILAAAVEEIFVKPSEELEIKVLPEKPKVLIKPTPTMKDIPKVDVADKRSPKTHRA